MDASISSPPRAPLPCRDLLLPEQIVLWLIRTAVNKDLPSCCGTLKQVFGIEYLPRALTALDALRRAAHESPLDEVPILPLIEPTLSLEEADLMTAIAAAQAPQPTTHFAERWGWPSHDQFDEVVQAIVEFAGLLANAGKRMTVSPTRGSLAAQGVTKVSELDCRERTIVAAVRRWVQATKDKGTDARAAIAEVLNPVRLNGGAIALDTILRNTSVTATRYVNVRCPACEGLADDEARLLHATSAVQRPGNEHIAFELLANWMKPAAVRLTMPAVLGLARTLVAEQHRLPLRYWCFPELNPGASIPGVAAAPALTTLH